MRATTMHRRQRLHDAKKFIRRVPDFAVVGFNSAPGHGLPCSAFVPIIEYRWLTPILVVLSAKISIRIIYCFFSLRFVILPETKFYQKKRGCYAARYFLISNEGKNTYYPDLDTIIEAQASYGIGLQVGQQRSANLV